MPIEPFLNWAYTHECWRIFTPEVPNWIILVSGPDGEVAAGTIWREYIHTDRKLFKKAIRTFDHIFFLRIPPLLIRPGFEARALGALAEAGGYLRKVTGAQLATLYRLERQPATDLVAALNRVGVGNRFEPFTPAMLLKLGDEFESWVMKEHRSTMRQQGRFQRRLAELYGGEVVLEHLQAHLLTDEEYSACCERYKALFERSWQFEYQAQAEDVDNELTNRFTWLAHDIWRAKKLLNFYFLKAGETDLAFYSTLEHDGRVGGLLTAYAQECRKYSPGQVALVELLRSCHQRGLRDFDLGAELIPWKKNWATEIDDAYYLEWPLGELTGKLWSLARKFKKTDSKAATTEGGDSDS